MSTPTTTSQANNPLTAAASVSSDTQARRLHELTAHERTELGITSNLDDLRGGLDDMDYLAACEDITYWDEQGRHLDPAQLVLVPPR